MTLPLPESAKQFHDEVLPRADIEFQVAPLSIERLISLPNDVASCTEPLVEVATLAQFETPTFTGVYVRVVGKPMDLNIPTLLIREVQRVAAELM